MAAKRIRQQRGAERAERIAAVKLIFDKHEIKKLKGEKLKDHLLAYQNAGAPNLKDVTTRSKVDQIREALMAAIDSYNAGDWKISSIDIEKSNLEQKEFDLDEIESDWEDEE